MSKDIKSYSNATYKKSSTSSFSFKDYLLNNLPLFWSEQISGTENGRLKAMYGSFEVILNILYDKTKDLNNLKDTQSSPNLALFSMGHMLSKHHVDSDVINYFDNSKNRSTREDLRSSYQEYRFKGTKDSIDYELAENLPEELSGKTIKNVVVNGDYETGVDNWINWVNTTVGSSATFSIANGGAYKGTYNGLIDITTGSPKEDAIQYYRGPYDIISGREYLVTFAAKSNAIRDINIRIWGRANWVLYGLNETSRLGTSWHFFTYKFIANTTASDAYFQFFLGNGTLPVFKDTFSTSLSEIQGRWTNYQGLGELSYSSTGGVAGGGRLIIGNNFGNDEWWGIEDNSIPYDETKLYRVFCRLKQTAGSGICYVGLEGRDSLDTGWMNKNGNTSIYGQYNIAIGWNPPLGTNLQINGDFDTALPTGWTLQVTPGNSASASIVSTSPYSTASPNYYRVAITNGALPGEDYTNFNVFFYTDVANLVSIVSGQDYLVRFAAKTVLTGDFMTNGDYETWTAPLPDGWLNSGAGTISKETTIIKSGTNSAKADGTAGYVFLHQQIHNATGIEFWRGKTVTLGVWLYATTSGVGANTYILIYDGISTSVAGVHSGSGTWEFVTTTLTIDVNATELDIRPLNVDAGIIGYSDGAILKIGSSVLPTDTNEPITKPVRVGFQEGQSPWGLWGNSQDIIVTDTWQLFTLSVPAILSTNNARTAQFQVGGNDLDIDIDSVEVVKVSDIPWTEYSGYFKGKSTSGSDNYDNQSSPGTIHKDAYFIRPFVIVNYYAKPGTYEIDEFRVEEVIEPNTVEIDEVKLIDLTDYENPADLTALAKATTIEEVQTKDFLTYFQANKFEQDFIKSVSTATGTASVSGNYYFNSTTPLADIDNNLGTSIASTTTRIEEFLKNNYGFEYLLTYKNIMINGNFDTGNVGPWSHSADANNSAVATLTAPSGSSFDGLYNGRVDITNSPNGDQILRLGNNSGNDTVRTIRNPILPYEPSKLYKIFCRIRQVGGTGTMFIGIAGRDITNTKWVNSVGNNNGNSQQFYVVASNTNPNSGWTEYTGYISGTSLNASAGPNPAPSSTSPAPMYPTVGYICPLIFVNQGGTIGTYDIDEFTISEVTSGQPDKVIFTDNFTDTLANIQTNWPTYFGTGEWSVISRPGYDLQLWGNSTGFSITSGNRYVIRFRAKADEFRYIYVTALQKGTPWANYGLIATKVNLTKEWKYYELEFTANTTASDASPLFILGSNKASVDIDSVEFIDLDNKGFYYKTIEGLWFDSGIKSVSKLRVSDKFVYILDSTNLKIYDFDDFSSPIKTISNVTYFEIIRREYEGLWNKVSKRLLFVDIDDGASNRYLKIFDKDTFEELDSLVKITPLEVTGYYLTNPDYEVWSGGLPDGWVNNIGVMTVAKETTIVHSGSASAKITGNTSSGLGQHLETKMGVDFWKGKTISVGAWIYATDANAVRIAINDGAGVSYSALHTGGGSWEFLTVTRTINTGATIVDPILPLIMIDGPITAYADGAILKIGSSVLPTDTNEPITKNGRTKSIVNKSGSDWIIFDSLKELYLINIDNSDSMTYPDSIITDYSNYLVDESLNKEPMKMKDDVLAIWDRKDNTTLAGLVMSFSGNTPRFAYFIRNIDLVQTSTLLDIQWLGNNSARTNKEESIPIALLYQSGIVIYDFLTDTILENTLLDDNSTTSHYNFISDNGLFLTSTISPSGDSLDEITAFIDNDIIHTHYVDANIDISQVSSLPTKIGDVIKSIISEVRPAHVKINAIKVETKLKTDNIAGSDNIFSMIGTGVLTYNGVYSSSPTGFYYDGTHSVSIGVSGTVPQLYDNIERN